MHKNVDKTNDPLDGVRCVVNTCHYNSNGTHCTASSIQIQPKNASTTEETDCATFKPNGQQ